MADRNLRAGTALRCPPGPLRTGCTYGRAPPFGARPVRCVLAARRCVQPVRSGPVGIAAFWAGAVMLGVVNASVATHLSASGGQVVATANRAQRARL